MKSTQTIPPGPDNSTFMNFPLCLDPDRLDADFAILGIPYGAPYGDDDIPNDQAAAPAAVRRESARLCLGMDHWDFDLDGPLFDDRAIRVVDCGDIPGNPADTEQHYQLAEDVVRKILEQGACPIILGGDHGVPIPVFQALDSKGLLNIVQIDAHIDWRDERNGVHNGYSSPMRRASEMSHVKRIIQVGMRAQGSARKQEVEDALTYGAELINAYQVHENGMAQVLERIPKGEHCYLTIDADGLDPSVMPAVAGPAPGGLLYHHVRELIHGLSRTGKLVGMDIVEITPSSDINGITALTAGQLILNFIGTCLRAKFSQAQ
jgi:agmatinase